VDVRVERVLDDAAYATLVSGAAAVDAPITAESEAEKPTRRAAGAATPIKSAVLDDPEAEEAEEEQAEADDEIEGDDLETDEPGDEAVTAVNGRETAAPKKKTRRGSRGGRGRKKKTAAATPAAGGNGIGEPGDVATPAVARIHVPDPDLGEPEPDGSPEEPAGDGTEAPRPKKKTRRGTRGGRGRKKKTAAAVGTATDGSREVPPPEEKPAEPEDEKASDSGDGKPSDWEYEPMSKWDDDLPRG
jgi:hypothetical protein